MRSMIKIVENFILRLLTLKILQIPLHPMRWAEDHKNLEQLLEKMEDSLRELRQRLDRDHRP